MSELKKKLLLLFFSFFIMVPAVTLAADPLAEVKNQAREKLNQLPAANTTPQGIIGLGVRVMMAFMGAIMFALIVYAGILWMTASGNEDKITKAKNIMVWSSLGVAVMLASYVIVSFVFGQIK